MASNTKTRAELKQYFVKNAIPTAENFAALIDGQLNQADDGVFTESGQALGLVAAGEENRPVLRLYSDFKPSATTKPNWMITLNPKDPADAAKTVPGLGITDGAGNTRLLLDTSGNLRVTGELKAAGLHTALDGGVVKVVGTSHSYIEWYREGKSRQGWIGWGDPSATEMRICTEGDPLRLSSAKGVYVGNELTVEGNLHITGSARVDGQIKAPGGLTFYGPAPNHIEVDGALYRTNDPSGNGQCYLTVDDVFYFRRSKCGNDWQVKIDTTNGDLTLKGKLDVTGSASLGFAIGTEKFNTPLTSGFYQLDTSQFDNEKLALAGAVPDRAHTWEHLIVVRHGNAKNNHQLQIAASYSSNDKLYFRKVATELTNPTYPPWNEIATVSKILRIESGVVLFTSGAYPSLKAPNTGVRTCSQVVTFTLPFATQPKIVVGLAKLDTAIFGAISTRIAASAETTTTACTIHVTTWSDSIVWEVQVSWFVYGT